MDSEIKVAIVHDWLTGMRGGEKVLEVLCELYPEATLFTLLYNKSSLSATIEKMSIKTSFIDLMPLKKEKYRNYLPLFPRAIESFDFSEFDLIISTSHCVAKGAMRRPGALHICYCHTPMRYVWEMYDEYFGKEKAGILTRLAMSYFVSGLRRWDVNSSSRVDYFIANSYNVAKRIKEYYNRASDVIYPPVDTSLFSLNESKGSYYLIVSALVPYKKVEIAVQAFNQTGKELLIVGSGPESKRLQSMAKRNIKFLGWRNDAELSQLYGGCRALIFPGVEDFGIVPLEAMSSGKPVIAFGQGGALETVATEAGNTTGIFFSKQTASCINEAIEDSEKINYNPDIIRKHALTFDRSIFKERIKSFIDEKMNLSTAKHREIKP
jgi:glycosyltransferase involved in cell wall biosynthesis